MEQIAFSWWDWTSSDLSKVPIEKVKCGTRVNALLLISLFFYLFFELLSPISGVIVPPLPPAFSGLGTESELHD